MSVTAAIAAALADAGLAGAVRRTSLGGGCIHRVERVRLADGRDVVAKTNGATHHGMFLEEAAGLRTLAAAGAVRVPGVLHVGAHHEAAVLLLEHLAPAPAADDAWRRFGVALAGLHARDAGGRYGFDHDNHLGTTPQPNGWCDDWVTFNAEHRLGHQVRLAAATARLTRAEVKRVEGVIARLDEHLPRRPHPALLHGDLWSGNAQPTRGAGGGVEIAVLDPACSVGDGYADIAMMQLFGGFPAVCFEAYARANDDDDRVNARLAVYQLYHVLNHVNLFGRGYAGQALALVGALGG